ncbi:hypothetical protein [Aquipseudomonas alcaligenes]|uniref:hypothetical protein n=1 Tax=Aquipseudomonas alcaligenes TaxID=43263 RepID=UPI001F2C6B14|nr:hypothetical protein [Pseudomonas alcaligenes]
MKSSLAIALLFIGMQANADVIDRTAKGISDNVITPMADELNKRILKGMAQGKGALAEGARQNLKQKELEQKEENRGELRTVKECIKPGNVIDDDVQECVRGYREKTW